MTPSEINVRTYGEAAVITGRSTIKAKVKGQEVSGEYRFRRALPDPAVSAFPFSRAT
jgi:hypothetical protein